MTRVGIISRPSSHFRAFCNGSGVANVVSVVCINTRRCIVSRRKQITSVVVAAGVVDAGAVRVAGCARDGVVVAAGVVDAVVVRVAGCARDGVVVTAGVVVDAVVVVLVAG